MDTARRRERRREGGCGRFVEPMKLQNGADLQYSSLGDFMGPPTIPVESYFPGWIHRVVIQLLLEKVSGVMGEEKMGPESSPFRLISAR